MRVLMKAIVDIWWLFGGKGWKASVVLLNWIGLLDDEEDFGFLGLEMDVLIPFGCCWPPYFLSVQSVKHMREIVL